MTQTIHQSRVLRGEHAHRMELEQRQRIWRAVKLWADRAVTAAFVVGSAYALWLILGRM